MVLVVSLLLVVELVLMVYVDDLVNLCVCLD